MWQSLLSNTIIISILMQTVIPNRWFENFA